MTGRPSGRCAARTALESKGIWFCKVGDRSPLVNAADWPMREAISRAFEEITGFKPDFVFSGWHGGLTEAELAVVEDREPDAALASPCCVSADQEQVKEALERALDAMHAEASRWVYLDAWPENREAPEEWQQLAKARAEWVVQKTAAALALLGSHEQEER